MTQAPRGARCLALVLLLALVLVGCRSAPPPPPEHRQVAPPLEPVRALHAQPTAALLPYWAALENGSFARNGLGVTLQPVATEAEALALLQAGAAEVYLVPLTPALLASAAQGTDLVILGGTPDLGVVTLRPLLASREFIFERFLRGVLEGIHAIQTQPEAMQALLARQGVPDAESALARYAARVPYLTPDDVAVALAAAAATDPRAAGLDPDRLLDQTLLRRLENSGFVAALYRG